MNASAPSLELPSARVSPTGRSPGELGILLQAAEKAGHGFVIAVCQDVHRAVQLVLDAFPFSRTFENEPSSSGRSANVSRRRTPSCSTASTPCPTPRLSHPTPRARSAFGRPKPVHRPERHRTRCGTVVEHVRLRNRSSCRFVCSTRTPARRVRPRARDKRLELVELASTFVGLREAARRRSNDARSASSAVSSASSLGVSASTSRSSVSSASASAEVSAKPAARPRLRARAPRAFRWISHSASVSLARVDFVSQERRALEAHGVVRLRLVAGHVEDARERGDARVQVRTGDRVHARDAAREHHERVRHAGRGGGRGGRRRGGPSRVWSARVGALIRGRHPGGARVGRLAGTRGEDHERLVHRAGSLARGGARVRSVDQRRGGCILGRAGQIQHRRASLAPEQETSATRDGGRRRGRRRGHASGSASAPRWAG